MKEYKKVTTYCKNGQPNTNKVKKGFIGEPGHRYHPTKGYRKEKGYMPTKVKVSELEKLIQTV